MGNAVNNEIGDLRPYLAKILLPDEDEANGIGFFCRPTGYFLTCYHVINPYLEKDKNEIAIAYQGEKYPASFCPELSCPDGDIAVLKLNTPPNRIPTLD
jgi:S1-C subfamily serine protease